MLNGFPPKVFIIGAQKSGTTQLAALLDQHPDICVAQSKEPNMFSRFFSKDLDRFQKEFSNSQLVCIDASTSYTCACLPEYFPRDAAVESKFNGVAENIKKTISRPRFIYIMRDPGARTFSAYWHQVRAGLEARPFEQAIKEDTYYLRTSHYYGQIELYLKHFPIEDFLFLTFEKFIQSPHETAQQCFRFLGLKDDILLEIAGGQNKSFVYEGLFGKLNHFFRGVGGLNSLIKLVKPILSRKILEWGASFSTQEVPKISSNEYRVMDGMFADSIKRLEKLTGQQFDMWPSRKNH